MTDKESLLPVPSSTGRGTRVPGQGPPRNVAISQSRRPRRQLGRVAAILCGPGEERSCLAGLSCDALVALAFQDA
jgi:hypothetical protein